MKKLILSLAVVSACSLAAAGLVHSAQNDNPAKFCKNGGTELIADVLEDALLAAHPEVGDIELYISQGACVSVVATHKSAGGVNTTALATSFCEQTVMDAEDIPFCIEHVSPAFAAIFHPAD